MDVSRARVRTDPRISRRRRTVERSRRRRVFVRAAVAATTATAVWAAFLSPLLAVREVEITGARHTTVDDLVRATRLGADDNLLLISTEEVARAAESLPWVRAATVNRILPGTVRVRVTERRPAVVLSIGAARWTLDARGNILASGRAAKGLPLLAGVEAAQIAPGSRIRAPQASGALLAFRSLPRRIRKQVAAIVAPTVERISFSLSSGMVIRYGAAERLHAKNEVLRSLMRKAQSQGGTPAYIDVRVPTSPAVSTARASGAAAFPTPPAQP